MACRRPWWLRILWWLCCDGRARLRSCETSRCIVYGIYISMRRDGEVKRRRTGRTDRQCRPKNSRNRVQAKTKTRVKERPEECRSQVKKGREIWERGGGALGSNSRERGSQARAGRWARKRKVKDEGEAMEGGWWRVDGGGWIVDCGLWTRTGEEKEVRRTVRYLPSWSI